MRIVHRLFEEIRIDFHGGLSYLSVMSMSRNAQRAIITSHSGALTVQVGELHGELLLAIALSAFVAKDSAVSSKMLRSCRL